VRKISVFEFGDHVRVALQITYLIDRLTPRPDCTLYLRKDCAEFMAPTTATVCRIRYIGKHAMMLRFCVETLLLGRKALVSTGPESASPHVQTLFARFLACFRARISVFMIVRDLKPERGHFLLPSILYSARSVLAVESDALRSACAAAGYSADTYLYPTPITADMMPGQCIEARSASKDAPLRILLTGSLDSVRRDYDALFEALALLRSEGIRTRVVVGGHCLSGTAEQLLARLRSASDEVVAAPLLSDADLDAKLVEADALLCLNRPAFYGGIKGSGAIGDAFFAGRRLLIPAELSTPQSEDARFYAPFDSGNSLAEQLRTVAADRSALRIPRNLLLAQTVRFGQALGGWLRL
jgi:hypothetical protein